MRNPEQTKQELRELLEVENNRLKDIKKSLEIAEIMNDLKKYKIAKSQFDDCIEQIIYLENKISPYSLNRKYV